MGEGDRVFGREARLSARLRAGLFAAALAVAGPLAPAPGLAHPPGVADEDQAVAHEVEAFREFVIRAIERRDVRALRAVYADTFTHTHASGRVDGKDSRIVSVLAGDPVIETASPEELRYRVFGDHTIIVTGASTLPSGAERQPARFRWMVVYVKAGGDWKIAASQATHAP